MKAEPTMTPIDYVLRVFGPGHTDDPIVNYQSDFPIGTFSVGDRFIPDFRAFEEFYKDVPRDGYEIKKVTHQVFKTEKGPLHHTESIYL